MSGLLLIIFSLYCFLFLVALNLEYYCSLTFFPCFTATNLTKYVNIRICMHERIISKMKNGERTSRRDAYYLIAGPMFLFLPKY